MNPVAIHATGTVPWMLTNIPTPLLCIQRIRSTTCLSVNYEFKLISLRIQWRHSAGLMARCRTIEVRVNMKDKSLQSVWLAHVEAFVVTGPAVVAAVLSSVVLQKVQAEWMILIYMGCEKSSHIPQNFVLPCCCAESWFMRRWFRVWRLQKRWWDSRCPSCCSPWLCSSWWIGRATLLWKHQSSKTSGLERQYVDHLTYVVDS